MGIFKRRRAIRVLSWQDAEILAAEHMRKRLGFRDARVTASGADGGIDVVSKKAIAQVKFHAGKTGAPDIQQLAGIAAGRRVKRLFFSNVGYTPRAQEAAKASKVALFVFDVTGKVTALNSPARKMKGSRASQGVSTDDRPSSRRGGSSVWGDFVETYKSMDQAHIKQPNPDKVSATGWGCATVVLTLCGIAGIVVGIQGISEDGIPLDRIVGFLTYWLVVLGLLLAGFLSIRQAWRAYERSKPN